MARPPFAPTEEQRKIVTALAGYGAKQEDIARILEISEHTLRSRFRKELDRGAAEAKAKVLQTLYKLAISGKCPAATFFFAKTRCGLRERGGPVETAESQPPEFRVVVQEAA